MEVVPWLPGRRQAGDRAAAGGSLVDPIMYPAADLLFAAGIGAANVLTNPERAEIMAEFKAA